MNNKLRVVACSRSNVSELFLFQMASFLSDLCGQKPGAEPTEPFGQPLRIGGFQARPAQSGPVQHRDEFGIACHAVFVSRRRAKSSFCSTREYVATPLCPPFSPPVDGEPSDEPAQSRGN